MKLLLKTLNSFLFIFGSCICLYANSTNVIDNFNASTNTNQWGRYAYTYGGGTCTATNKTEMAINDRVGTSGHSMRLQCTGTSGAGFGFGMGVFKGANLIYDADWSAYSNIQFYLWNNNGAINADAIQVQLFDTANNEIEWDSQPDTINDGWGGYKWRGDGWYILNLKVSLQASVTNNQNFNFSQKSGSTFDWQNVKQIQFQLAVGQGDLNADINIDEIALVTKANLTSSVQSTKITPSSVQLIPGQSIQFSASDYDANNNKLSIADTFNWSIVEGDAGTIDAITGKFIALKYGYVSVKVTSSYKNSQGNPLTAYVNFDIVDSNNLQQQQFTIGPNLINTKTMLGIQPRIRYYLQSNQQVTIEVFDELGHLIRTIIKDQIRNSGANGDNWDLKDDKGDLVASNVYLIRISSSLFVKTAKIVIIN